MWNLRAAQQADAAWIAELRAVVLFDDLTRLGRFDPVCVRERFVTAFRPEHTLVIDSPTGVIGCIAVRPEGTECWIEHFYVDSARQGQGIGGAVLRGLLADAGSGTTFRLNVLRGSAAVRLYQRLGFMLDSSDEVDLFLVRQGVGPSGTPGVAPGTR